MLGDGSSFFSIFATVTPPRPTPFSDHFLPAKWSKRFLTVLSPRRQVAQKRHRRPHLLHPPHAQRPARPLHHGQHLCALYCIIYTYNIIAYTSIHAQLAPVLNARPKDPHHRQHRFAHARTSQALYSSSYAFTKGLIYTGPFCSKSQSLSHKIIYACKSLVLGAQCRSRRTARRGGAARRGAAVQTTKHAST